MSCRRVRDWLHRDVESLDETQRLVLEDHLAACERCRGDRHHLRLLQRAGTALPVAPTGSREYSRAIARALLEDSGRPAPAPSRRWVGPAAIAAVALASVAVVVLVHGRSRQPPARREAAVAGPPRPSGPAPATGRDGEDAAPGGVRGRSAAGDGIGSATGAWIEPRGDAEGDAAGVPGRDAGGAADIVEHGALVDRAHRITAGAAVPADTLLRAAEPTRARLASFRVEIAASSEVRWIPAERMVVLARGTLDIEIGAGGPARLVTERFEVEIEDAALTVDPAAVRVARGVARIVDRSRRPLARVAAGATWRPSPAPAASTHRPAQALLALAPSESDEAEARMFLAEVAHASGALDLAVERYLAVAGRFGELPAGESALYAAARIELRRSRARAARALLTRYLARYPAGRYADDARRELATVP